LQTPCLEKLKTIGNFFDGLVQTSKQNMSFFSTMNSPATLAITGALFLAAFFFYQWLLPKPIPGIPYNDEAVKSVFGDVPSMLKDLKGSKSLIDWISGNNKRHDSPMVQIFTSLFGKPVVVISDFRESQVQHMPGLGAHLFAKEDSDFIFFASPLGYSHATHQRV
jgi:hypothetical protein